MSCNHGHAPSIDTMSAEQAGVFPLRRSWALGRSSFAVLLASVTLLSGCPAWARQVFFPSPKPTVIPLATAGKPGWLTRGTGDDGYLKIEVVSAMKSGCVPLGDAGFLKIIATEETQLTVSMRLTNISSVFQGREIPIAILDGRSDPGGCLPFAILDAGMTLVPLARLEPVAAGVDTPRIELFVRSTSSSKVNLVGPGLAMLGVATVFATGGAASTVASFTSALAQPAFKQLEGAWDKANSGLTPSLSGDAYSWATLRGVAKLVFPIFTDKTNYGESDASAFLRLQNDQKLRTPEIAIELRFSHYPTAFELLTNDKNGLPIGTDIPPAIVLNHPNQAGVPTVAQLLDQEMAALSKATDESALKDACNLLVTRAKNAGFALKDRAMALYLAMNKTRAPGWYETELENCTRDQGQVFQTILGIWGAKPPVVFQYADARKRFDEKDEQYSVWSEAGVPFLESFRKALIEPRIGERERLLTKLSAGSDIELGASSGPDEWPALPTSDPATPLPQLQRLAAKRMVSTGCFTYRPGKDFAPSTNPGDLLLLDDKDRIWVASPRRSTGEIPRFTSVEIFEIDDNWKAHYESLFKARYYGNPIRGGCTQISAKLSASAGK